MSCRLRRALACVVLAFCTFVCGTSSGAESATARSASVPAQAAQAPLGCPSCHGQLSATLPEAHPKVSQPGVSACMTCHAGHGEAKPLERIVHLGHFSNQKFTGTCWSCHETTADGVFRLIGAPGDDMKAAREKADAMLPFYRSWAGSNHLDHVHALKEISCGGCHGNAFPEERASEENCLECHKGYAAVAQRTAKMKPNPHEHHLGEIRCTLCHKAHEPSVDYCRQCHDFGFKFPGGK